MTREIKFRGKDEYGIWHYGFLTISEPNKIHTISYQSKYGYWQDVHVLPESVGQYTGLKDKNGVDIYEGDILAWTSSYKKNEDGNCRVYNNSVEFYAGSNYVGYRLRNKSFTKPLTGRSGLLNAKAIIIGNIHQNPELL